jgi:hypothetical protein
MPVNVLEYNITAGIWKMKSSQFGRAEANYGLTRFMTIGGGVEYQVFLSIQQSHSQMFPFNRFQNGHKYGICTKCGFKGLLNYYIGKSSF